MQNKLLRSQYISVLTQVEVGHTRKNLHNNFIYRIEMVNSSENSQQKCTQIIHVFSVEGFHPW